MRTSTCKLFFTLKELHKMRLRPVSITSPFPITVSVMSHSSIASHGVVPGIEVCLSPYARDRENIVEGEHTVVGHQVLGKLLKWMAW